MKAEQSKLPPTPLLGRKVFLDPQDSSPARSSPSSLHKQTIYEQGDYWGERIMAQPSPPPGSRRPQSQVTHQSCVSSYTPIVSGSITSRIQETRNTGVLGVAAGLGMATEHKSAPIKPMREAARPVIDVNVMAEVVLQEPGCSGGSRAELQVEQQRPHVKDLRMERQLSNEQLIQARRDELPQEVWRERAERERRLERQTSSEQEVYETRRRDRHRLERQESSEHDTGKEPSDRRSGGG